MRTVFLDHQSSTPALPEALEAMRPFLAETFGNPSSLHRHGLQARESVNRARARCAALIHAESADDIIFTSNGTEATNLAVKGAAYASQRRGKHLVISAIEHPAVRNSAEFLETQGFSCTKIQVDRRGWVDPADVQAALTAETILVCIQHVNHDVGTIEPIGDIARLTNERGIPLFVDAVASAGWLPIDVQGLGVNLLSLSPHRFYGPKGVGVLYRHRRTRLVSLIHGGDQEGGRRAGTENVAAVVGAGVAAEVALRELNDRMAHTSRLQKSLWGKLQSGTSYLALNGPEPGIGRISNNLNVSAEFTEGEGQLLSLDMAGVAVASGTSCVSRSVKVSPVLEAMGVDRGLAQASIIFSLGKDNTLEEIDYAAQAFAKTIARLREMSPLWADFEQGLIDSKTQPGRGTRGQSTTSSAPIQTH
jgi:cysteine desulfurase